MRIGVPRETKDNENRVGLTPHGVRALCGRRHDVVVERGAGSGCGFADADYASAGATLGDAIRAWDCDLVVKVKEPLEPEYPRLRGQIVFTYFHLAGAPLQLTEALLVSRTTAIAYETIEDASGRLPLLAPMSAVAGAMAPLVGAYYLAKFNGGRGTLLATVLGESHGKVVIVGDGVVGRHACDAASGLGAAVVVLGVTPQRAKEFERPGARVRYLSSTAENLLRELPDTDVLIGSVLRRGARAPHVVTEEMVKRMPAGSVIVDVSIDQGGCVETSRPTSHSHPVFVAHGVTHYCVTNMPGAYPRTSTLALTEATLPYALLLADQGIGAVASDAGLAQGVNAHAGRVTYRAVADALGLAELYSDLRTVTNG
ncbi:MAG TPA: alanine dehydrogenase [Gammaproteobacteria bacterium]|nr:alanine dehydrogenase [Gammaproteobacteria bacterium]